MITTRPTREKQALREVGRTVVRPWVARLLAAAFLLTVGTVPALELAGVAGAGGIGVTDGLASRAAGGLIRGRPLAANRLLLEEISRLESALEERSVLQKTVVPYAQWLETALLGDGNRQALPGRPAREGWLFYRPDVEHLLGPGFLRPDALEARVAETPSWVEPPHPDPRPALRAFRRRLADRGIELLVVPTPVKPTVHPERFAGRAAAFAGEVPLRNPSTARWIRDLEAAGIAVFDPAQTLARAREKTGEAQFLATDTHWTPEAMDRVARALAERVEERLGPEAGPRVRYRRRPVTVTGNGDLVRMLRLPKGLALFPSQEVTTRMVLRPDGGLWAPSDRARVLLLGDSFTNVFSRDELGWGRSAGLAEQLSYHLGRPLDRIAVNAGGSHTTREALARSLRSDPDRLDDVRLVIYQFAVRELSRGDWRPVDGLLPGGPGDGPAEEGSP